MPKELKVLNSNFFDLFNTCQKRGILSFLVQTKALRNLAILKNDFNENYYKRLIIQDIIMASLLYIKENKKIDYTTFILLSKTILKDFLNKKENEYLESKYKKSLSTNKQILISQIEDNLKTIFDLIKQEDCINISDGNIKDYIKINDYLKERIERKYKFGTSMKFQNEYYYKVEIPFICSNENKEIDIIYFINDLSFYNPAITSIELSLVCFYLAENYNDFMLKNIILYDTTSLKRTVVPIVSLIEISILDELFKIMVLIEYKNVTKSKGIHCEKCLNSEACTLECMTQDKHTQFHTTIRQRYGKISSKIINEKVKKKLLFEKGIEYNE